MSTGAGRREEALGALEALHAAVEQAAAALAARHAERLQCRRGCHACCQDELTVFPLEAERIRRAHPELLAEGEPHPAGACAFLDAAGACRVYAVRPYVCRTQGLPLRWLEEGESGEVVEYRDVCPLNEPESLAPITSLPADACWELGPWEARLAALERRFSGEGPLTRVALRSLFRADPAP